MTSQNNKPNLSANLPDYDREKMRFVLDVRRRFDAGELGLQEARDLLRTRVTSLKPYEIALAEQEMQAFEEDQCKKEDLQQMLLLYAGLFDTTRPELPKGHPLLHYYQENEALEKWLLAIEDLVQYPVIWNQWHEIYDALRQYPLHLARKQNQLYPLLERKGFDRPTTTMWTLDDACRDVVRDARKLLEAQDEEAFIAAQAPLIADLRDLMHKEEQVLYPTSLVLLSAKEFDEMGAGDREIGYAWIHPETDESPTTPSNPPTAPGMVDSTGTLPVTMGALTLEQINLIYKHMPVDLAYVDENDRVCFYTDTKHRIFPRSRNVIGRDVKNCHPRSSVHIVEEIVEKFRSGEEDQAEFWIQKPGLFVYIFYTAIRDEAGTYRGVLEMMQECSHIRSLEGSRTLLTWGSGVQEERELQPEEEETEEVTANESEPDTKQTWRALLPFNGETRLEPLLEARPDLRDWLPTYQTVFTMLKTPLARIMVPKATLSKLSERSGVPLDQLIQDIQTYLESEKS